MFLIRNYLRVHAFAVTGVVLCLLLYSTNIIFLLAIVVGYGIFLGDFALIFEFCRALIQPDETGEMRRRKALFGFLFASKFLIFAFFVFFFVGILKFSGLAFFCGALGAMVVTTAALVRSYRAGEMRL